MKRITITIFYLLLCCIAEAQTALPKPTKAQLAWHNMEFYLFTHFGPNTFTDKEWGHGDEPEDVFNPTEFDAEQWCNIAKEAGAKGIIITAKHHDGFCLWPSKFSTHTVRESKWKDGKGDVLKELSAACKKYDLKFGVYISPWDRNHPDYGTEKYNDVFVNMMKELFTNYGPIWELWWDGANGEGPNGKKQIYDWKRYEAAVRSLSPKTIVFSDIGPDVRWCGNESGIAGETNWNTLDTAGFKRGAGGPPQDTLSTGNVKGKNWIPAECDVSIRPGWFYHKEEDGKVKTPEQLFNLYLKSVGRGANFLLNVPPDRRGLITKYDSAALVGFSVLRKRTFEQNLSKSGKGYDISPFKRVPIKNIHDGKLNTFGITEGRHRNALKIEFATPTNINCVTLRERIINGQVCSGFNLIFMNDKQKPIKTITGTTIGRKRILTFPLIYVSSIMLSTGNEYNFVEISEIEAYLIDEKLIEK